MALRTEIFRAACTADLPHTLLEEWRALAVNSGRAAAFAMPEWIDCWITAFKPRGQLLLFAMLDGERLRALLPLWSRPGLLPVLQTPGNVHSVRFDALAAPDLSTSELQTFADQVSAVPGWSGLALSDVPEDGVLLDWIRRAWRGPHGELQVYLTPYTRIASDSQPVEEFLNPQHREFRKRLMKKRRKLEKRGKIELRWLDPSLESVELFFKLEASGWKGREGTAILSQPDTSAFYRSIAALALNRGWLRVPALYCDDRMLAATFAIHCGRHFVLPKMAFDEEFGEFSPGQQLYLDLLPQLPALGVREFDFLGPSAEWKERFVPLLRPHFRAFLFKPNLSGLALYWGYYKGYLAARYVMRELLPQFRAWLTKVRDARNTRPEDKRSTPRTDAIESESPSEGKQQTANPSDGKAVP